MKKKAALLFCLATLLYAAVASAQLYKSIGTDGRVTYSDMPPASAAHIEKKASSQANSDELPPVLAAALKQNPVILYTTGKCKPCDEGRDLLGQRGIPFAEKTVNTNEDLAVLRQAGGDQQLPLLSIGGQKKQGFETDAWHAALSAAGYPTTSQLPASYQRPGVVPAAGEKPKATQDAVPPTATATRQPPAPANNSPSGFRF